ncbi:unnamed protein product, partial [Musa textilis]
HCQTRAHAFTAVMDLLGRAQRCHDCIRALEEERKKIEAFRRELPLCLHLVTRAIESVRHVMGDDEKVNHGSVTEELIPLMSEHRSEAKKSAAVGSVMMKLRSVQLLNQEPDTVPRMEPPKKPIAVISKKIGSAFQPFQRQKYVVPPPASSAATAIPATTDVDGGRDYGSKEGNREKKEEQLQPHRKARRRWSPELHRCFLHALHQLGGSDVATPKQIRELMKVDGFTIDEVKSHLQSRGESAVCVGRWNCGSISRLQHGGCGSCCCSTTWEWCSCSFERNLRPGGIASIGLEISAEAAAEIHHAQVEDAVEKTTAWGMMASSLRPLPPLQLPRLTTASPPFS